MKHFNESCKEKDWKFAGMFVFISDFIILLFLIQMPLPVWSDLFYIQVLKADSDTLYCILVRKKFHFASQNLFLLIYCITNETTTWASDLLVGLHEAVVQNCSLCKKPLKTFIHSHFAGDKQCSKSSSVKSFYFMEQTSEPLAGTIPTLLWLNLWFLLGCHK